MKFRDIPEDSWFITEDKCFAKRDDTTAICTEDGLRYQFKPDDEVGMYGDNKE